MHLKIFSN